MRRGLWFVAGAGAGVYAVLRGRRAAEALTVDGLTDRLQAAAVGVRIFRDEVAQGAADKEAELRSNLAALAPRGPVAPALAPVPEHPHDHLHEHPHDHAHEQHDPQEESSS